MQFNVFIDPEVATPLHISPGTGVLHRSRPPDAQGDAATPPSRSFHSAAAKR